MRGLSSSNGKIELRITPGSEFTLKLPAEDAGLSGKLIEGAIIEPKQNGVLVPFGMIEALSAVASASFGVIGRLVTPRYGKPTVVIEEIKK